DAPQTSWDLASPLACESIDLEPAEVLILDLLYVEAVQFGKVHGWIDRNWPVDGERKLKMARLDINKLDAKLTATKKKFGL
ncbi:MAG: hypothetical protein HQL89_17155, partial [Magnetococcales bacterium]|nr:hypothetical protein [Magnetococcales bacterium]